MSELRLVPPAVMVWAASLVMIVWGLPTAIVVCVLGIAGLLLAREAGQALLVGALGGCAIALTWVRVSVAEAHDFGSRVSGYVRGLPKQLDSGDWLVNISVAGYPVPLPAFVEDIPDGIAPGAVVEVSGAASDSTRPGVGAVTFGGDLALVAEPEGFAALACRVRERFSEAVVASVGTHSQGLLPGMVLGDTSLQSPEEAEQYVVTGLSHLSAVSGSNCMYVAAAALIAASALRLGFRARLCVAGVALIAYAGLVGLEPSVLRASVSGLVGFVAMVASTRAQAIHALALSVVGLILVDSDLAVNFAFALSVAATVGIVVVSPLLYSAFAPLGWPELMVRALSVAIAADVATAPIVAGMAGRVSLVAAIANVLVSPVTAVVTVVGMIAALLAQMSVVAAVPLLWIIQPLTWWIRTVAEVGAGLPSAALETEPLVVLVVYGWVLAGYFSGRVRLTAAAVAGGFLIAQCVALAAAPGGVMGVWRGPIDIGKVSVHVVETEEQIDPVPAGTRIVVVLDTTGSPHDRPVVTPGGLPVLYPNRDGPVEIYPDGTQRSVRGEF